MYRYKDVTIRKFEKNDIHNKVEWINNSKNNEYLHYDLPLEYDKTLTWYENIKDRTDRFDAVIEYDGIPVGLIGIIGIDNKNKKGEEYIVIGNTNYKNKGIATKAEALLCLYGFKVLGLKKIFAYVEYGNQASLKLHQKSGFRVEGFLKDDLIMNGRPVDRFILGMFESDLYIPKGIQS